MFAAYGLPIVSEALVDPFPYDNIITATYPLLRAKMQEVINEDYSKYRDIGLRIREKMTTEFQFRKVVEQAISESVGSLWR